MELVLFGSKEVVKQPKRCVKAIKIIHKWIDDLHYYTNNHPNFRQMYLNDAIYVENLLRELAVDKKIDHAKFIQKFKHLIGKENEELKKENEELKKELNERGEKIAELVDEVKELKDDKTEQE